MRSLTEIVNETSAKPLKIVRLGLAASLLGMLMAASGQADAGSYSFKVLARLGDAAPPGAFHINDYEPGSLNNRGDVIYGTDVGTSADPSTWFGEGVFLQRKGQSAPTELARSTGNAPGGGVFDVLLLGQTQLNDLGDAAYAFTLSPFGAPVGVNSGVYRYSPFTHLVRPVVLPGHTHAPAGGTFAGVFFGTSLDNFGNLIFQGIYASDQGVHLPDEDYVGLGMGVFEEDRWGRITSVVSPGDAAPGGGTFDLAGSGGSWINDLGDVAFSAHVAGEEAHIPSFPPQSQLMNVLTSVYIKQGATGKIRPVAHAGDPAPRGGTFRDAYSPVLNDFGATIFLGDLTPAPDALQTFGVFLRQGNQTIAVARPGDLMPGGELFKTASYVGSQQIHINNRGQVAFNAELDTGTDPVETGLYVWAHGSVRLVARTGTVIPHVGTVAQMVMGETIIPPPPTLFPNSGAINNDLGQVLFGATLMDGSGVLLLATPEDTD